VGYLLAGIVIGPVTPGFVADTSLAGPLAEIGVMLLMSGVGLPAASPAVLLKALESHGALATPNGRSAAAPRPVRDQPSWSAASSGVRCACSLCSSG
jgi:predicted Kef-type K+ transport protein